jgi:hypothetical protein
LFLSDKSLPFKVKVLEDFAHIRLHVELCTGCQFGKTFNELKEDLSVFGIQVVFHDLPHKFRLLQANTQSRDPKRFYLPSSIPYTGL